MATIVVPTTRVAARSGERAQIGVDADDAILESREKLGGRVAAASIVASAATTALLARSPPPWPPMPSATTQSPTSGRASRLSSLISRTLPTWLAVAVLQKKELDITTSFYSIFMQDGRRSAAGERAKDRRGDRSGEATGGSSNWPVSMSANRVGAGRPVDASAVGEKPSPPIVHQNDWVAKVWRWANRRAARNATASSPPKSRTTTAPSASSRDAGNLGGARQHRRRRHRHHRRGDALVVRVLLQRVEQNRLGGLAPGVVGIEFGRRQRLFALRREHGQRKMTPDAVDRGHEARRASPRRKSSAPSQKRQIGALL